MSLALAIAEWGLLAVWMVWRFRTYKRWYWINMMLMLAGLVAVGAIFNLSYLGMIGVAIFGWWFFDAWMKYTHPNEKRERDAGNV
jgi:hypothetical protein